MDKFSLYAAQFLSFNEHFPPRGHKACPGCGIALAVRQVYKALEGTDYSLDEARWQIPWHQGQISTQGQGANRTQPALLEIRKGTADSDSVLQICFDNEACDGKIDSAALIKRMAGIAAAGGCAYSATACPSHPFDLIEKVRKGWEARGTAFIHILCPCPVAWGFDPQDTVKLARMAVETRLFPLYEIVQGYYDITIDEPHPRPVGHYLARQERFSDWKAARKTALQDQVNAAFTALKDRQATGR